MPTQLRCPCIAYYVIYTIKSELPSDGLGRYNLINKLSLIPRFWDDICQKVDFGKNFPPFYGI